MRGAWNCSSITAASLAARAESAAADKGSAASTDTAPVALFRRPLGLPIPHTGIIPRNKDRIGQALGDFIAGNFLTPGVLDQRLRRFEPARRLASLNLSNNSIGPEGVKALARSPHLGQVVELDLAEMQDRIGPTGWEALRQRFGERLLE